MSNRSLRDAKIIILKTYGDFLYSRFGSDLQEGELEVVRVINEEFTKLEKEN